MSSAPLPATTRFSWCAAIRDRRRPRATRSSISHQKLEEAQQEDDQAQRVAFLGDAESIAAIATCAGEVDRGRCRGARSRRRPVARRPAKLPRSRQVRRDAMRSMSARSFCARVVLAALRTGRCTSDSLVRGELAVDSSASNSGPLRRSKERRSSSVAVPCRSSDVGPRRSRALRFWRSRSRVAFRLRSTMSR